MRIVSLLPSATEIVYARGLQDQLVVITHECDYPDDARTKPVLVESVFPNDCKDMPPGQVDAEIGAAIRLGQPVYRFKPGAFETARPDVILAQGLCDVCAVPYRVVVEAIRGAKLNPQVLSLDPTDLTGILTDIRRVGEICGRIDEAGAVVDKLEERVGEIAGPTRELSAAQSPRVAVIEWTDPLYCGGHWTPELVELAGGRDMLGTACEPSRTVTFEEVQAAQPEVIVIAPCGYDLARAKAALPALQARPGWAQLPAVQAGRVYFMDANATLSRPGPRMVDALEDLAQMLQPDLFPCLIEARRWSA